MEPWVRDEPADRTSRGLSPARTRPAPARGPRAGHTVAAPLPADVAAEIRRVAAHATARHREQLVTRMERAVVAFERGHFPEALRLGTELARELPAIAPVRRLAGFAAYRVGRWRDAARHLGAFVELTEEADALPTLMDVQRALGRHARVTETWNELRRRSPDPDVLAEGRIVAAASLADRGDARGAIALLAGAGAARSVRNPADRHLRQWYALADLYERVGDLPRARELFVRVARADPGAYDVSERLDALGPPRLRGRPRARGRARGREPAREAGSEDPGAATA